MSYQDFKQGYIDALLWSETDYGTEDDPSDENFDGCEDELDCDALAAIDSTCGDFWQWVVFHRVAEQDHERAGHDFCLTRNGHGAGFWDGDWQDDLGDKLTNCAKAYGTMSLYRYGEDEITVGG